MSDHHKPLASSLRGGFLFTEEALSKLPTMYYTTDEEFAAILSTHDTHGNNWLNSLHIAVNLLERDENDKAKKFFEMSLKARPNPLAYRGMIVSLNVCVYVCVCVCVCMCIFVRPFAWCIRCDHLRLNIYEFNTK